MTRLLDQAGIPLILVGDSLGMVVLGLSGHHAGDHGGNGAPRPRRRARKAPAPCSSPTCPIAATRPPEAAVANAQRLVAAGAEAVKAEGGPRHPPPGARHHRRRHSLLRPPRHAPPTRPRGRRLPRQRQNRSRTPGAPCRRRRARQRRRLRHRPRTRHPARRPRDHPAHLHPHHRHRQPDTIATGRCWSRPTCSGCCPGSASST